MVQLEISELMEDVVQLVSGFVNYHVTYLVIKFLIGLHI
jgi:hypothetical protein